MVAQPTPSSTSLWLSLELLFYGIFPRFCNIIIYLVGKFHIDRSENVHTDWNLCAARLTDREEAILVPNAQLGPHLYLPSRVGFDDLTRAFLATNVDLRRGAPGVCARFFQF